MTESIKTLIHVGFKSFGITIIEAECSPKNLASASVMERAGLRYKGEFEREDRSGKMKKRLHYEINNDEWKIKEQAEPEMFGLY